ncbi:MAG TPA: glycoside hydrolase family 88 protein, partial [Verrucomicrobiae bacterium]
SSRFREEMRRVGESNDWKLGPSHYNADDQCVGQMYAELSKRTGDTNMIAPMRAQFDLIIAKPSPVPSLDFTRRGAGDRWSWCDSLFMAPPAWTRLWTATGDRRYLDYAVTNWWITSEYLYDTHEHLFYRDSTYFNRLEANGKRVFWGRGNGWVMGGLVRVIQDLPQDHPARGKFVQQFREMAGKVLECQQPDGLWRSSLLDPESYPLKETSGSGFYAYALAWGVNNGLLDRERFAPAVDKAWIALVDCVTPEGKLTHVQPIGADPKKFDVNHTDAYGVGAFLLAGSEVYQMNGGTLPPPRANATSTAKPTAQDFQNVVERYREIALHGDPDWSSEKSASTSEAKLRDWISTLSVEGSWPDVDYQDQDRAFWKTVVHLDRTRLLAQAWANSESSLHHDAKLENATMRALDFWLAKRFQNPNWWWNQIGVPGFMADIVTLLNNELTGERRADALEVLAQSGNPRSGSGANTIWIADLALQRGALMHDAKLIADCSRMLAGEIKITTEDGIQPDFSFHQHYARLQQFSYGRPYLTTAARIAWQLRGTPWSVPNEKVAILADLALRGDQWMCRGIYTVPSTIDRSVSRPGTLAWSNIRTTLKQLVELLPERAAELENFIARQNGEGEPLIGARTFPRSDFITFQRPQFSFFLKTLSDRTLLAEVGLNSENLKGTLLNCGDHYLLRDGREYFDLAPVWDWKLLPGVTFAEGAGEPQRQSFVGAVTDGTDCATAMDYRFGAKDKTLLSAKKFWACHNDVVICLMADLNAPDLQQPVRTALDQCRWRGAVTICDDSGNQFLFPGGETNLNARWVHHAGFGYAPLGGLQISVRAESASGSWKSINSALSGETVTTPVFLPVLEHGIAPADQNSGFVIVAGDVSETAKMFSKPSWRVLRNDSGAQAVKFADGTMLAVVYRADETVGQGKFRVASDQPCIVLARGKRVWISDPTQRGGRVTIRWNGKSRSANFPADGSTVELR